MQAAAWLVNTSSLYEGQGITIDQNWMRLVTLLKHKMMQMMNQHQTFQMINGVKMKYQQGQQIVC